MLKPWRTWPSSYTHRFSVTYAFWYKIAVTLCLRLASSRPFLNLSLIHLPRAKGAGNPRETNRPGKYHLDRTFRKSTDASELTPMSFAIFTLKRIAVVFKHSVEIVSVGLSCLSRQCECWSFLKEYWKQISSSTTSHWWLSEEKSSVQWSSLLVEQLTYRTKISNFINEFKIKLSRHSFK